MEARKKYIKLAYGPPDESEEDRQQRKNEFQEWRKTSEYNNVWSKTNRGYFLTQQDALDFILKEPEYVAECGYYTHLLIEKHYIGWEGYSFMEDDGEYWLELVRPENPEDRATYQKIERPECFAGTVCFA
jgi:hypothetical protein